MLQIIFKRKKSSLLYLKNPKAKVTWDNAAGVNMKDTFMVKDGEKLHLQGPCQTVANTEGLLPNSSFLNTITPGKFFIKPFVAQRNFYGRIHGIVGAITLKGERIDNESVTPTNKYRWLVHDLQKGRKNADGSINPSGLLCSHAWSDGCLILLPRDLEALGRIFDTYRLTNKDLVEVELVMED